MLINTHNTFRDHCVRFSLFQDNLSRNSCIQLFRERLLEKSVNVPRNSRNAVWVIINIFVHLHTEPAMPRSYNEDLRFRAMWMKEFLGYCIEVAKNYSARQKCLNTEEVKAYRKFSKVSLSIRTWNL